MMQHHPAVLTSLKYDAEWGSLELLYRHSQDNFFPLRRHFSPVQANFSKQNAQIAVVFPEQRLQHQQDDALPLWTPYGFIPIYQPPPLNSTFKDQTCQTGSTKLCHFKEPTKCGHHATSMLQIYQPDLQHIKHRTVERNSQKVDLYLHLEWTVSCRLLQRLHVCWRTGQDKSLGHVRSDFCNSFQLLSKSNLSNNASSKA